MQRVLVWDLPLRIFHWSLVFLVTASVITGQIGGNWMVWHGRFGIVIAGLLAFRIAWGFLGTRHSRFTDFIRGPGTILAYLRGNWQGLGHNPLGAMSVIALLATLVFQVACGLVGNDDIAFQGPLYALVSKFESDLAIGWHKQSVWLLAGLVTAHLGAIAYYTRIKNEKLVSPMVHGFKETTRTEGSGDATSGGGWLAFFVAAFFGVFIAWLAAGGILPPPPPPPPDIGF